MNWFEKISQRPTKLAVDEQRALSGPPLFNEMEYTVQDYNGTTVI